MKVNPWTVAIATYGLGDVATTHYGMSNYPAIKEAHPLSDIVLDGAGTPGMIVVKTAAIALFYGAYLRTSKEHRIGIPIGLALLGTLIVANNLAVIQEASRLEN